MIITTDNLKSTSIIVGFVLTAISGGIAYQSLVGRAEASELKNDSQQEVINKLTELQQEALLREVKRDAEIKANTLALSEIKTEQKELREEVEESNEDQQEILIRILNQLEDK